MPTKDYEGYYWRRRTAITVLNLQPMRAGALNFLALSAYCLDRPDPMPVHQTPREAALADIMSAFQTLRGN